VNVVHNKRKYWDFIRNLRNDSRVKKGFIQQHEISLDEHYDHMGHCAATYRICLIEDKPAGYARVDYSGDISVCVHPDYQKQGVGTALIEDISYSDAFAKIKIENEASLRLFEKCGFKKKYYIMEKE